MQLELHPYLELHRGRERIPGEELKGIGIQLAIAIFRLDHDLFLLPHGHAVERLELVAVRRHLERLFGMPVRAHALSPVLGAIGAFGFRRIPGLFALVEWILRSAAGAGNRRATNRAESATNRCRTPIGRCDRGARRWSSP